MALALDIAIKKVHVKVIEALIDVGAEFDAKKVMSMLIQEVFDEKPDSFNMLSRLVCKNTVLNELAKKWFRNIS
jgi:hypothetical protein